MNLHPTQQRIMELVMQYSSAIQTVEMHTAGEPVRIVLVSEEILSKMPPSTTGILAQRDWFKREADWLRVQTLREPRGHADMYGVWLLGWVDDQADPEASVLFTHNEGYSTMCGHATISLCRFLVDAGLLSPRDPGIFKFTLQVPCGPVKCSVHVEWNQRLKRYTSIPTKKSTYLSVPSFAVETDVKIGMMNDLQGNLLTTPLTIDLSYGGAFYAFVNMDTQFGVKSLSSTSSTDLLDWARKTLATLRSNYGRELVSKIRHPSQNADLCYLYGLIMVSHDPLEKLSNDEVTQICVFADGQVDRSPCGSGVQAHLALLYKKHPDHFCNLDSCPSFKFTSIIGTQFQGRIHESVAGYFEGDNAVIVEVSGQGFYSGCNSFIKESQDHVVGDGFLLPK